MASFIAASTAGCCALPMWPAGGAAHLFKGPSAGEEEDAQADESEGAADLVEDVTEVEPGDGDGEADNAQVDQRARWLGGRPTRRRRRRRRRRAMGEKIGLGAG